MKKLSKILVLIFVVATLFSVFALVSSAEQRSLAPSHTKNLYMKWDGKTDNQFIGVDMERVGMIVAKTSEDGNNYVVFEPKNKGTSSANNLLDIDFDKSLDAAKNPVYNVEDYPYMMLDFDIMTPTGEYENNVQTYIAVGQTSSHNGSLTNIAGYFTYNFKISEISSYLSAEAYKWQHDIHESQKRYRHRHLIIYTDNTPYVKRNHQA